MPKIRVLVVDDAVVMRRMLTEVLNEDPQIEVVGAAANGSIALQKIPQVNPDIITLDVEMPVMDGLTTLKEIRKTYPKLPVIMFSSLTDKGASTTLEALSSGASDYATKPNQVTDFQVSLQHLRKELLPKVKAHCRHIRVGDAPGDHTQFLSRLRPVALPNRSRVRPIEIVCIGTSTGGPNALADVFRTFPGNFPVPIVIVQHMPPKFTGLLAERLNGSSALRFHEGEEGMRVEAGHAYIAYGGRHMEVRRHGLSTTLHLQDEPPENSCRPAVDVLFRSVTKVFGAGTLGVILTGMGQDGMRGCQLIREAMGQVIAQDEKSSVVWGMPGAVVQSGLADVVVPLDRVCQEIVRRVQESRTLRAA